MNPEIVNNRVINTVMYLMPLLMMRHRRIPRAKWRDNMLPNGKHWIEQAADRQMDPIRRMKSLIGYHVANDDSLIGMAMVQGRQREVVSVGLGIQRLSTKPLNMSVSDYAESQYHKLTQVEIDSLGNEDEVILRRLCLILALKQSYLNAIGQPVGFDFTRLEFNVPEEKIYGDGEPLRGWEFRVWQGNTVIKKDEEQTDEKYQCACAFFRGWPTSRFVWQKDPKSLESWVQFLNVDQLITVLPKLAD
ncbi:unnamed protein product [Somion occarium]|uniref:Uncharacterized protein n=1 Tax=Somion occarium TaxID=3059160 RepID=A0ABP1CS06_9APHY